MRKRLIVGGSVVLALALSLALSFFALGPRSAFAASVRHVKLNCGGQLPPICYTTIHDAVNAAAPGDTVLVDPGTFTETSTLNINVPIRLVGSGSGVTTLRGSLDFTAIDITLSKPGTLIIAGFTIEGNGLPHPGASFLIQITDAQAGDNIRIGHNTFLSNEDSDPNHATFFTEALHNFATTSARLDLIANTFEGFSWVSELFEFAGPVDVEGNQVFDLNGTAFSGHVGFDEFAADPLVIPNRHLYQQNVFSKYVGAGILVESNEARFDDLAVLKNTFALSGPNGIGAISIGGFGTNGFVKLAASGNVIHLGGAIDGIQINQGVSGILEHNVVTGSSTAGTNGIAVSIGANVPTSLAIHGNRVTMYDTGLSVANAAFPSGTASQTVNAHSNCIVGNVTFGANNTTASPTAITPDATNNWWGAASGPFNATSNPGGAGNAVSDNISFIPFLTALSPSCP
jgi:hypothetical protein